MFSALVRLLLSNAMGLTMLLSGASSFGQLVLCHLCSNATPSTTADTSISMYVDLVSL